MNPTHVINADLVKIWTPGPDGKPVYRTTVAWGDPVEITQQSPDRITLNVTDYRTQPDGSVQPFDREGFIAKPTQTSGLSIDELVIPIDQSRVLKADFIDVQQGDASLLETPKGKIVLVDGGETVLFARYLATRYRSTSDTSPKDIDCILVTHGDADHFSGLGEIHESESNPNGYKRFFIRPHRVYHNGLVKRPSRVNGDDLSDAELLGETTDVDGVTYVTDLHEDLLQVPDERMNEPFREWKTALQALQARGNIDFSRLASGEHDKFDFLRDEEIDVKVIGPIVETVNGKQGLRFLGTPKPEAEFGAQPTGPLYTGKSASHTINGHSVVLQLTYRNVRFLFAGDLNRQSEEALLEAHNAGEVNLETDILKVPHHGSADFSEEFLKATAPVVSVVSSGDENALKEYIHPRATLMGALGKYSRPAVGQPLVFVTEMVAFFTTEGFVTPEFHELENNEVVLENGVAKRDPDARSMFFAFSRAAFGTVKVRTDGDRLLVWTNSGQRDLKEAYAYEFEAGAVKRVKLRRP